MPVLAWVAGAIALLVAGLLVVTAIEVRRIEARFPAVGRLVDSGGLRLHLLDVAGPSDRPPLLLIHGASGNLRDLAVPLRPALEGHYRLLFVDRPGHGWSERPDASYAAPAVQAAALARLLDRLGIPRAILVAHSFGGTVAAAFAVNFPEKTAGLVFVAPATHPWPGGIAWHYRLAGVPWLGAAAAGLLALPASRLLAERVVATIFSPNDVPPDYAERAAIPLVFRPSQFLANGADVAALKENVVRLSPRYPEIAAPTVIVTGDRDSVVWPHLHSEGLERDIAGAKRIVLPGVGHMPHHVATDAVVRAIDEVAARAGALPR